VVEVGQVEVGQDVRRNRKYGGSSGDGVGGPGSTHDDLKYEEEKERKVGKRSPRCRNDDKQNGKRIKTRNGQGPPLIIRFRHVTILHTEISKANSYPEGAKGGRGDAER